jgi:cytochrome c biogenesis protein CcdA
MGTTFINMLPYALGIAVSPVPMITVILTLFSQTPKLNGVSFLLGWAMGITLPAIVVIMLAVNASIENDGPPSQLTSVLRILGGIILMAIAIRNRIQRYKPDNESSKPILMRLVDAITPWRAWLIGFLFADVTNPKNMALTIAGCIEITSSPVSQLETFFLLTTFVLVASLGVASPVMLYLLGGEASRNTIGAWRKWLMLHKKTMMALLFIIFGLSITLKGVAGLSEVLK